MTIATNENTTMASLPTLSDGIALTHLIVAEDVERAGRFYSDVLGGEIVLPGEPKSSRSRTAGSSSTSAADPQMTSQPSPSSRPAIPIASAAS
jgi:hypothetical protein